MQAEIISGAIGGASGLLGASIASVVAYSVGKRAERGARSQAQAARDAASTSYAASLAQQNHAARRTACIRLAEATQTFLDNLERYIRLGITPESDNERDPFAADRTAIEQALSALHIHGPLDLWRLAHMSVGEARRLTYDAGTGQQAFAAWRALDVYRLQRGPRGDAARAVRRHLRSIRAEHVRRLRDQERTRPEEHRGAVGNLLPDSDDQQHEEAARVARDALHDAIEAGIITLEQRVALLAHAKAHDRDPHRRLRDIQHRLRDQLHWFSSLASAYLNHTNQLTGPDDTSWIPEGLMQARPH